MFSELACLMSVDDDNDGDGDDGRDDEDDGMTSVAVVGVAVLDTCSGKGDVEGGESGSSCGDRGNLGEYDEWVIP